MSKATMQTNQGTIELELFGMIGYGRVVEEFKSGRISDDDEVTVVPEDAVYPLDHVRRLARGVDGEDVVVLVAVVARLVGPQAGERLRNRGRLQPDRGHVLVVDDLRHTDLHQRRDADAR